MGQPHCSSCVTTRERIRPSRVVFKVFRRSGLIPLGDRFCCLRYRHLPTRQADSSGTTTRMTSASVAVVVKILCRVDGHVARQMRLVLVPIQPSSNVVKYRKFQGMSWVDGAGRAGPGRAENLKNVTGRATPDRKF